MPLAAGTRLGPYEILASIGAGGMGEVYKAHDSRLGRDVALKILPTEVANDPARRQRFETEARAVAALNHPNIVAVHDVEQLSNMPYMVTELVDGESLRGAKFGFRKAIDVAVQVASGLAAAHDAGIVHRDLKPDNILLTREGRVKILDFGLAKMQTVRVPATNDTLTAHTEPGVVIGTAGYMSPEQVSGLPADHRSDIFSFGVVLYELIGGIRAFQGETSMDVMHAILRKDPPELPETVPPGVRQVVSHCLEKDPANRFHSASDLAFALRNLTGFSSTSQAQALAGAPNRRSRWPLAAAALGLLLLGAAATLQFLPGDEEPPGDPVHFTPFATDPEREFFPKFSPDGKSIAYVKDSKILVRSLDAAVPTQLTDFDSQDPFWSADGAFIYFTREGQEVPELWRVGSTGGKPVQVLKNCPQTILSRDGRTLVIVRHGDDGKDQLHISSPPGADPKRMPATSLPPHGSSLILEAFAPDGTKFIVRAGADTWLIPFPAGKPARLEHLAVGPGGGMWWFPDSRHVLLLSESKQDSSFYFALADTRSKARHTIMRGPGIAYSGDLSPDGRQFVYATAAIDWDIVEFGTDGKRRGPLVASTREDYWPDWSPKGDQLVYQSDVLGPREIWTRSSDGQRTSLLVKVERDAPPAEHPLFSPDGRRVSYTTLTADGAQIWVVPAMGGRPVPVYLLKGASFGGSAAWADDGESFIVCDNSTIVKIPSSGSGTPKVLKNVPSLYGCKTSRDGRWIAYTSPNGVGLLASDGSGGRKLFPEETLGACEFTRDSKQLLCVKQAEGAKQLVTWDLASGRQIESRPFEVDSSFMVHRISIHPDGKRLAATVGKVNYDLWIMDGFPQPAAGLDRLFHHWTTPTTPSL